MSKFSIKTIFVKIVSYQKLLEKRTRKFFLDFSEFLSICQYFILGVCCFIQFERKFFISKLRRISQMLQMCCNQVRNIIAYINTREKIRIFSSHCQNKMHYCSKITLSYKTVTLSTLALFEIV